MTGKTDQREPDGRKPIDWQHELAQHDRWLRTVVLARIGERGAVDEVMQELALAAVKNGHQLRDREKIAPWLYRLSVVGALQYRRRAGRQRKRTEKYAQLYEPTEQDSREHDPLEWLVAEEQRNLVRVALKEIPRRDAEILLLKYTEHWSYKEIANHLGMSESAIEARLHRARKKMRTAIRQLDPMLGVNS